MNFICREDVLAIVGTVTAGDGLASNTIRQAIRNAIEALPMFPAPNPDEKNNRNVMGQTEDQFWEKVEDQDFEFGPARPL